MNKNTKTYQSIKPLASLILDGKILCIDPSTGSQSSMPGFAWYEKGKLVECGTIEVDYRLNRSLRLYEIARTIREDFPVPDILIVEYIPPVSYRGGMNSVAVMALQKSLGAIIGALPFQNLIEIPTSAWKKYKTEDYVKSDEWDAITIGRCAVEVAKEILEEPDKIEEEKKPRRKRRLTKKKKSIKKRKRRRR